MAEERPIASRARRSRSTTISKLPEETAEEVKGGRSAMQKGHAANNVKIDKYDI
jgi:hypothetical protein